MKWRLYLCSDCAKPEGAVIVQVPDDAHEERGSGVDYCPGCGSYLSLLTADEVEVRDKGGIALTLLRMREQSA